MENEFNELNISQIPALEVLSKIGYTIVSPANAEAMRGSLSNVVLKDILIKKLTELNRYEYKGKTYSFSEKNIHQAIKDLDESLVNGLITTNEKIYEYLTLGKSYPEKLTDGSGSKSFNLHYIDWKNIYNNAFHVVEEFKVRRMDGKGTVRPDLVLFVNGIPLGVIECKKASISVEQGVEQMIRNQQADYVPQLFKYVQIVMSTNKNETKYATCGVPKKFWGVWKEEENTWFDQALSNAVESRLPTTQDQNIISLFHPERLLHISKYFTLFDKNTKKIARYQQYFATHEIIKTIEEKDREGNRQSGVIWHTQGSGKSLTMVMLANYILSELVDVHPKVLIITDRIDLDEQIHKTFRNSRLKAERASSGSNLVNLINNDGADIITSLVHKFDNAAKIQEPILSKDIFILVDESHRTQYGELHIKMKKVFPNACYIGFTGTPLMKKDKSTMTKFGKLIHKYTIKDGVDDKAILPLLYEGKMIEQTVNQKAIDLRLEMITRNLNEKQKEEVMKKWSRFEAIASSQQRIQLIAYDINEHFTKHYKSQYSPFRAMLATSTKKEAIQYLRCFEELGDLNVAVVISAPDQREGYDSIEESTSDVVLKFWKEMMRQYNDEDKYEQYIKSQFVDGDEVDLLIVVDKLLTGFDAPRATVLYIDKQLREHNLLQAIARVNRLYDGKDFGYIVDYRGLINNINEAMQVYSGAGLEQFDGEDLNGALVDVISIVGKLRNAYSNLIQFFSKITDKTDKEQYEVMLGDDGLRDQFYDLLSTFSRFVGIALESEHVYNALREEELSKYKRDTKFFQELRASVKLRYSDSIDHKEYEDKMRKLMDQYISADDIIRITNPVNIMDKQGFADELTRLGSPRSKADAIRTRMSKHISKKWDENPAYFKKFSERIQAILEEYKNMRISEQEYLQRFESALHDLQQGDTGQSYPKKIMNNPHAQAFYGASKGAIGKFVNVTEHDDVLSDFALAIDEIIQKHCKVDWRENKDVHNRMEQDIDGLLFKYKRQYFNDLELDNFNYIIEQNMRVALNRY